MYSFLQIGATFCFSPSINFHLSFCNLPKLSSLFWTLFGLIWDMSQFHLPSLFHDVTFGTKKLSIPLLDFDFTLKSVQFLVFTERVFFAQLLYLFQHENWLFRHHKCARSLESIYKFKSWSQQEVPVSRMTSCDCINQSIYWLEPLEEF